MVASSSIWRLSMEGLEGGVEIIQSFLDWETGLLDLLLTGPFLLGFRLFREDMIQNLHNIGDSPPPLAPGNCPRFPGYSSSLGLPGFPQPVHSKFTHTAPRHI